MFASRSADTLDHGYPGWRTIALVITGLLLTCAPVPAFAQSRGRTADSMLSAYASVHGPGASLLIMHDGRVARAKGYGLANVERQVLVTPRTNFRLASLSKQFTATAVMLLVADGVLHYDDPVASLLPELPAYASAVTLRHLLNHTGGLPDYEDFVPDSQTAQVHDRDIPVLISHASAPLFAAGTRYRYSNTGYVLLALVVERASGQRFAAFLARRIFHPLRMSGTVALEEGWSHVSHRAYGYTLDSAGVHATDQSNTSATLGDGGIYTCAVDLAKWDRAMERHTLVRADAQRLAWSPPTLGGGETSEYGFGWFVDHDHGTIRLRHHGESRGFTNGIVRYPDRRVTVVVLTNRTGGAPWDIAQRIAELYLDPASGEPSSPWRP